MKPRKKSNKSTGRDYKSEYRAYHGTEEQKKKRASRNAARRKVKAAGKAVGGKDVDHKDGNPKNNALSNLRAISKRANRSFARTKTARKKKI